MTDNATMASTAKTAAFSPKRCESPLRRHQRDVAVAEHQFVEMNWKFLKHENPPPPQFSPIAPRSPPRAAASPTTKLATATPSKLFQMLGRAEIDAALVQRETEYVQAKERRVAAMTKAKKPQDHASVDDITGETQRKEMLNRIMAEMEALVMERDERAVLKRPEDWDVWREAVEAHGRPHERRSSAVFRKPSALRSALRASMSLIDASTVTLLPQRRLSAMGSLGDDEGLPLAGNGDNNDDGDDDDARSDVSETSNLEDLPELRLIRERQHKQRSGLRGQEPRIFWQKSGRVRLALDIPKQLQHPVVARRPDWSPRRMRRRMSSIRSASLTSTSTCPAEGESETSNRRTSQLSRVSTRRFLSALASRASTNRSLESSTPGPSTPAAPPGPADEGHGTSPRRHKPQYGAWYLPETQWWDALQAQKALEDELQSPGERAASPHSPSPREHCHHPPHSRHHRPAVPGTTAAQAAVTANAMSGSILPVPPPPPSPSTGARAFANDPIASRASVLHAEIPQSYIGKEYRNYILLRGARVPDYLK